MLIPRFSLRWLIGLITVCGAISFVLSYAFQGEPFAIGFAAGLASLGVLFALHASAFAAAYLLAEVFHLKPKLDVPPGVLSTAGESPFAMQAPFASPSDSHGAQTNTDSSDGLQTP